MCNRPTSFLGKCNETSNSTFDCLCPPAWRGAHCETSIDACANVTCQNNGVCRSSLLNYTCQCLGESYSGRHCEIKASSMAVKQAVSRSFAFVAIVALICVAIFIVTMDVLKYGFGVDPTERQARKKNDPHYIVRFIYVNPETL